MLLQGVPQCPLRTLSIRLFRRAASRRSQLRPFTVFAPTDDAFAKLPEGTLKSLLKPENKKNLTAILTYHVVAGNVKAADVIKLSSAKTLNGQSVTIKTVGGKVLINGATVVKADIATTNGTIHVIDTVLLPK